MTEPAVLPSDPKELFSKLDEILEVVTDKIPTEPIADCGAALTLQEKKLENGVKWLASRWQNGLNGILGDQTRADGIIIALEFLDRLKRSGQHGPYMIVSSMDVSTGISVWLGALRHFPSMNGELYFANQQGRAFMKKKILHQPVGPDFPIILTTYNMVLVERNWLAKYDWEYVVVDEALQLKKKHELEMLEEVKRLPVGQKLLLTTEPFQKNLAELWSLLNFALPTVFSSREEFDSWFDKSGIEGEKQQTDEERSALLSKLHDILRTFLLRGVED